MVSLIFFCAASSIVPAIAQDIPFFGRPAETFEGDAVVFAYRSDNAGAVPLENITSWRWDFDGDVTDTNHPHDSGWDEVRTCAMKRLANLSPA